MIHELRIPLNADHDALQRLLALQRGFANVCNALAPLVQQTRVWNRVALHHLAYRKLREQFPDMGSQMVCNAIYSVSRMGRLVFQHPQSPFNIARMNDKPLPMLHFTDASPVYFDRHTLSLKDGQLSMFTLDGRLRFQLGLALQDEALFHASKLNEVVLMRQADESFALTFQLESAEPSHLQLPAVLPGNASAWSVGPIGAGPSGAIPPYVMVGQAPSTSHSQARQ